jgi:crossover junction endodeoxyribonuclease RuvC
MTSRTIGIDPGNFGAVALFVGTQLISVHDMPIVSMERNGKVKNSMSAQAFAYMIKDLKVESATVERVGSFPNQGVSSVFAFGRSAGVIEGVLAALDVAITYVQPTKWQHSMGRGIGKDSSRHRAMELYPSHSEYFKLKKHDGRAEAVLIGAYGIKLTKGIVA